MALMQLIYASRPFGFDNATLDAILVAARHFNPRDDITGALLCRDDIYLQLLEGPEDSVRATFARITRDDRHMDLHQIWSGIVSERLFPSWAMKDDPVESWMWSRDEVESGMPEKATRDEVMKVFAKVASGEE